MVIVKAKTIKYIKRKIKSARKIKKKIKKCCLFFFVFFIKAIIIIIDFVFISIIKINFKAQKNEYVTIHLKIVLKYIDHFYVNIIKI